jgi:hypothetical protein
MEENKKEIVATFTKEGYLSMLDSLIIAFKRGNKEFVEIPAEDKLSVIYDKVCDISCKLEELVECDDFDVDTLNSIIDDLEYVQTRAKDGLEEIKKEELIRLRILELLHHEFLLVTFDNAEEREKFNLWLELTSKFLYE